MVSDGQLSPQMVEEKKFVAYLKLSVILNFLKLFENWKKKKTVKDTTQKKKKMTNKKC